MANIADPCGNARMSGKQLHSVSLIFRTFRTLHYFRLQSRALIYILSWACPGAVSLPISAEELYALSRPTLELVFHFISSNR
jgi:hypothetical protein